MSMERQDFDKIQTLMALMVEIVPGLGAYSHAAFLVSRVAQCGNLYSRAVVPGAGVSDGLARLFFSDAFLFVLVHAFFTQILSTMFVICVATFYRANGLFLAHAMAILAGLRKRTASSFFRAVAIVGPYIAFFWPAFGLLDVPGEFDLPLMLLGGAAYMVGSVCIAAACHAVPVGVLEAARGSGFGVMRSRLVLIAAAKFCAAAAALALLDGFFLAVLVAFPSQSRMVAVGTAMNAVLCTVVVVMMGAQPVIYLVFLKNFRPDSITLLAY